MKQTAKIIFVIIGTIIGAGFASGQEIYLFFGKYQTAGIIGIMVSSTLMGILIYKIFTMSKQENLENY